MKICKLKLKNLNSFREAVELDFENPPLNSASLVAITGADGCREDDVIRCDLRRALWKNPAAEWNREPKSESSH